MCTCKILRNGACLCVNSLTPTTQARAVVLVVFVVAGLPAVLALLRMRDAEVNAVCFASTAQVVEARLEALAPSVEMH